MTKKMESLRNSKFKKFENDKISNLDVFKGGKIIETCWGEKRDKCDRMDDTTGDRAADVNYELEYNNSVKQTAIREQSSNVNSLTSAKIGYY